MRRIALVVALGLAACSGSVPASNGNGNPGGGSGTDGGTSCLDACSAGTIECNGTGESACAVGPDGCLAWSTPVACPGTQTCSLGFCANHNTYSSLTSMPDARAVFGTAATADHVYVVGGMAGATNYASMNVYAFATDSWTTVALPGPTASPVALAGPDGRIYSITGYVPADDVATCVNSTCTYSITYTAASAYSPAAGWTAIAEIPTQRVAAAGATGPDGLLYVVGGATGSSLLATTSVEAYNTTTGAWQTIAGMATPRARHAVVTGPDGKIYALGGTSGIAANSTDPEPATTSAERYNPTTKAWEPIADMLKPRLNFAAAAGIDGRIYAFGGETAWLTGDGTQPASVEAYTPATNTWQLVASMPLSTLNQGAAVGASPLLLVIGGQGADFDGKERASVAAYTP
jgi:N-acetylneuraminic acid mutarotase